MSRCRRLREECRLHRGSSFRFSKNMRINALIAIALLSTALTARADFSYTTTRRTVGGHSVAGEIYQLSKYYFKGGKMKIERGDVATILDFDGQTITTLDNKLKTVAVRHLGDTAIANND